MKLTCVIIGCKFENLNLSQCNLRVMIELISKSVSLY